MGVYLWTNDFPPFPNSYSYDFRNKTWAECQADWWELLSWTAPSVWADGIYYNAWQSSDWIQGFDLSTANKVTLSIYFKAPSWFDGLGYTISHYPWNTGGSGTWIGYNNTEAQINWSTVATQSKTPSTWNTLNIVYDLVNKTYAYSNYISKSGSLNDTQVAAIRACNTMRFTLSKVSVATVSISAE